MALFVQGRLDNNALWYWRAEMTSLRPQDSASGGIEVGSAALSIVDIDAVSHGLKNSVQFLGMHSHVMLQLTPLGNVTRQRDGTDHSTSAIPNGDCRAEDNVVLAVKRLDFELVVHHRLSTGERADQWLLFGS